MRRRALLTMVFFGFCLAGIFVLALEPNTHNNRLWMFPRPMARWLDEHDDFANFFAFAVFGSITFALPRVKAGDSVASKTAAFFSNEIAQLVWLLLLVSGLELAQHWIPGRISSWRDVETGSAGVISAWILHRSLRLGFSREDSRGKRE